MLTKMWQRPASVPYPTTWRTYIGRRALSNGQLPHFRIQDCPVELFSDVIDHMTTVFLRDELICDTTNFTEDEVSVQEFQVFWRKYLEQRMALVALVEDEDGITRIAGVNITMVATVNDQDQISQQFKGLAMQKKRGGAEYVKKRVDIFNRFGVSEYLATLGLSVSPEYRGQGLSLEILLARIPLCQSVGLRVTCSIFTTENSQQVAKKAGFKLIFELPYNEYKVDGALVFPYVKGRAYQCMALEIE